VGKAIRAARQGDEWDTRVLAWGCVGAIGAIAVHSVFDFNMYIPANPLLLTWIAGIAVCLPLSSVPYPAVPRGAGFRAGGIALACLLVTYTPARILAETTFKGNLAAERRFCRFGICDTEGVLEAQTRAHGGDTAALPMPVLLETVRRDPAQPNHWCTLGEAMLKEGRVEQARACFSNALALGPNMPPVVWRSANFDYDLGEHKRALARTSWLLENAPIYYVHVFDLYDQRKTSITEILAHGLGSTARPSRAYLRRLMEARDFDHAAMVWNRLLSHRLAEDRVARDYVNFLYNDRRYEIAARTWALYLGGRAKGYLETTWLFDGDFEIEPLGSRFDWTMSNLNDDVEVAFDSSVARTGARSLRIRFAGKENVHYNHVSQTAFVTTGVYRFEAFVRAQGITTDQGIYFRVFDAEDSRRLDVRTGQVIGTTEWKPIEQIVRVRPETRLLTVQVVRQESMKFDSNISGTAWLDDVSLTKVE
jgi:hypothetical protein